MLQQHRLRQLHHLHFWFHVALSLLVFWLATRWLMQVRASTTTISLIISEPPAKIVPFGSSVSGTPLPLPPTTQVTTYSPAQSQAATSASPTFPALPASTSTPGAQPASSGSGTLASSAPLLPPTSTTATAPKSANPATTITWLKPDFDHNQSIAMPDFKMFVVYLNKQDLRADFNNDKTVDGADFSIMMYLWTN